MQSDAWADAHLAWATGRRHKLDGVAIEELRLGVRGRKALRRLERWAERPITLRDLVNFTDDLGMSLRSCQGAGDVTVREIAEEVNRVTGMPMDKRHTK